jgi:mannose-1-phosphate guanylyltransferase
MLHGCFAFGPFYCNRDLFHYLLNAAFDVVNGYLVTLGIMTQPSTAYGYIQQNRWTAIINIHL